MAENGGDLGSFLAGFVIGGLIGAGVALLTAPQSGEETRAMIGEKGIELRDRAEDLAAQTAETYEAQIKRLQAAVDAGKKGQKPPAEEEAAAEA